MKGWLRNAKVVSAIGFIIVMLLFWLVGSWCAWPIEFRFLGLLAIMVLWVLSLLIGTVLKNKASGMLENVLRKQVDDAVMDSDSGKRKEISTLRLNMLAAIETLKTSKLGKTSGSAALYELPWYMVIGHPAAGKSTAILQSGLTFPFSDKHGVQGVGGTRDCDWFFSTEGILLDTAGRYATDPEGRLEWLGFLRLLKKYRSREPVNGILLAVSLPELLQYQSEEFKQYVRKVRERIDEITNTFSLQVPIYLVFTKLDLLGGFKQFFLNRDEDARSSVWGATLEARQGQDFDLEKVVAQQFDQLARGLLQTGEEHLLVANGQNAQSAYFAFPIEFNNLKQAVLQLVRLLSEKDPYHVKPLLRGFYFTSALQEGTPRIVAAGRIKRLFGIGAEVAANSESKSASQSFFLRNLFREVIFPDQHLIANQAQRIHKPWRLVGMGVGLLLLCICAGLWSWSYIGNQNLLERIKADRISASRQAASLELHDKLSGLVRLQNDIETLDAYHAKGTPWQLGFGLYQGDRLDRALRREYFAQVKELMLLPVKRNLEGVLTGLKPVAPAVIQAPEPVAQPAPAKKAEPVPRHAAPVKKPVAHLKSHKHHSGGGNNLPVIKISQYTAVTPSYRQVAYRILHAGQAGGTLPAGLMPVAYQLPIGAPRATALAVSASSIASASQAPVAAPVPVAQSAATAQPDQKQVELDVAYNALKTYMMLHQPSYMEQAQLSDQLPRYWRSWIEANKGQYSDAELMPLAEQVIAFYVSQIKAPDLPLIDNDDTLVATARDTLRNSFKRLSGPERVFNAIRAQANTRYAPLTVGRILDNHNLDVVAGSQMVEGAFTRQAWSEYVNKAIDAASRGQITGDDWVLATRLNENLSNDGNVEQNKAKLMALYRAQYIEQWKRLLMGVAVRDFSSAAQSASAMTQLADSKTSPIKLILARVAYETAWDNPSSLQNLSSAGQSVLARTAEFISGNASAPQGQDSRAQYGVVGGYFAGVAQLVSGDNAPINGYLQQLAKVKARLVSMASINDGGSQAMSLIKSPIAGQGSEVSDTMTYVDNALLAPVSENTRQMVRPLLLRPMMQTYASLVGSAGQSINQAWQQIVLPQWRLLADKYPFNPKSSTVASMDEIDRFAHANSGVFDQFVSKYLDGLVERRGNQLVPRSWGGMGVHFNPAFITAANQLEALANSSIGSADAAGVSRFEIQPLPTPGLAEIDFTLDGQQLQYRNGSQVWQSFSWPGNGTAGVSIQALNYSGSGMVIESQSGRMGFLRLLSKAHIEEQRADGALLSWTFRKEGGGTDKVKFNFRSVSGLNPLALFALNNLSLPERVTM